jgi:hypothetical protein
MNERIKQLAEQSTVGTVRTPKMTVKDRWKNFILPYIHKVMERIRHDPDCSYDDWKKIKQNYRDTVGKDYERKD